MVSREPNFGGALGDSPLRPARGRVGGSMWSPARALVAWARASTGDVEAALTEAAAAAGLVDATSDTVLVEHLDRPAVVEADAADVVDRRGEQAHVTALVRVVEDGQEARRRGCARTREHGRGTDDTGGTSGGDGDPTSRALGHSSSWE